MVPTAMAAWKVEADGTGFVGKGDVQLPFGWNNKQLQDNAEGVEFAINSVVVTEVSWTCTNTNNQNVQERERTTTTTTQGLLDSVARDTSKGKNGGITGFNLEGFAGPAVNKVETEGQPLNSCPTNWILTPAGDPEVISSTGGLTATHGGTSHTLPPTPTV